MAEKVNITFQPAKKKVPKGQLLQGSRNWQKCSALVAVPFLTIFNQVDHKSIRKFKIDGYLHFLFNSSPECRPWKDHLKSDLRSDQDHLLKKDLRSDQDHIFLKNDLDLKSRSKIIF
jgi:hypothetical protein